MMNKPTKKGFSLFYTIGVDRSVQIEEPDVELDDERYEQLAAEAEAGYDVDKLTDRPRRLRPRTYHVELWRQPLYHWLTARLYHRYDCLIYKVPGYQMLTRLHRWRYRRRDEDMYVPLPARQDIRCYDLRMRHRTTLATLDVDEATYERLGGKARRTDNMPS